MQLRAPAISHSSLLLLLSIGASCVLSARQPHAHSRRTAAAAAAPAPAAAPEAAAPAATAAAATEAPAPAEEGDFLKRRAIYVRWGSLKCPVGSQLLYHGFMANSFDTSAGSGYNYLCMHPNPQFPQGFDSVTQGSAQLFGVEYESTGVPGLEKDKDKDAACAVCQYQNGGATYVEWGHGERRHNPSTPTACSKEGHETMYTGLVMGSRQDAAWQVQWGDEDDAQCQSPDGNGGRDCFTCPGEAQVCSAGYEPVYQSEGEPQPPTTCRPLSKYTCVFRPPQKSENICVDLKRAAHPASDAKSETSGSLYTTKMAGGASDEDAYSPGREVGCTVCGIPARTRGSDGVLQLDPKSETSVYTRWGSTGCGDKSRLIYTGFIAGPHYRHHGGGANSICMTISGAAPPSGYSDAAQQGNMLYGTEYQGDKSRLVDAACAVCEYIVELADTYIQWGRENCSNKHTKVYTGLVMANHWVYQKSMNLCVHDDREPHAKSDTSKDDGNLLYSTQIKEGSFNETSYPVNSVVACTECAATGAGGAGANRTVFTRWGSGTCPDNSSLLYKGWMASVQYTMSGGGANTLCMHVDGEPWTGTVGQTRGGNFLYGMKYQDSETIDKNHNKDAGCAVCELDRWEAVYTQWGRSERCTNGHQTLYSGFVMAGNWQGKNEFVCVDEQRYSAPAALSSDIDGGQLYTTEMNPGSSDEDQYPPWGEVGCSVCAAISEKDELPFAAKQGNALHGEWVRLRTLHTGQEVTVGYGFEQTGGAASTTEETRESSSTFLKEVSGCFSATFSAGVFLASAETGVEVCAGLGVENGGSVANTAAEETSWDDSLTETMEDTFSVPDSPPAGTPESATIQTFGVHLWQWQWTIIDSSKDRSYTAKANSHYLFSPNDPADDSTRRPCCFPGQEFSLWYPFNCKSQGGMLKGAASHCHEGLPTDSAAHIAAMSTTDVAAWLGGLGLSGNYASTVKSRRMDGKALAVMVKIVDKAAVNHGDSDSTRALELVKETFAVGETVGDAYIIMDALIALLASGEVLRNR